MLDTLWYVFMIPVLAVIAFLFAMIVMYAHTTSVTWWKGRNKLAYLPQQANVQPPATLYNSYSNANFRALNLLGRVLGLSPAQLQDYAQGRAPIRVKGGATGRQYAIYPRFLLPITVPAERIYLCAAPYNTILIPRADTTLAQALYLSCPTTERDFLKLCHTTRFC